MRSDISTLGFNKEERQFIEDYFRYVREKMTYPTHPEIHIGAARYPLGRFKVRRGLIRPFVDCRRKWLESKESEKMTNMIEAVDKLVPIIDDLKKNGKTVNSGNRNKE